ncbi:WD40 repeat-containing protein MSI4-like protein [Tanacetum coccineum]
MKCGCSFEYTNHHHLQHKILFILNPSILAAISNLHYEFHRVSDSFLILWDARVGTDPITKVEKTPNSDVHRGDWIPIDKNYILSGSDDQSVCRFDRRNLTSDGVASRVHKFVEPKADVVCVQWCPDKSSVFGSSSEDGGSAGVAFAAETGLDEDDIPLDGLEVSSLGISQEIVNALAKKGITKLFPIQKAVLDPAMQGRDMIGRARTGTFPGKTVAFGISIMDKITRSVHKNGKVEDLELKGHVDSMYQLCRDPKHAYLISTA